MFAGPECEGWLHRQNSKANASKGRTSTPWGCFAFRSDFTISRVTETEMLENMEDNSKDSTMSKTDLTTDQQLERDIKAIFDQVHLVPADIIASIHSFGYCEDNKTFMLMADTTDGATLIISIEPGKPVHIGVQR